MFKVKLLSFFETWCEIKIKIFCQLHVVYIQSCLLRNQVNIFWNTCFLIAALFFQLGITWLFHELSFKCCFCCLIHKRIIMLKHFLFIIFMSISRSRSFYVVLSDFFFFIFIFIVINRMISWIRTYFFFCLFSRMQYVLLFSHEECEQFSNSKSSSSQGVA